MRGFFRWVAGCFRRFADVFRSRGQLQVRVDSLEREIAILAAYRSGEVAELTSRVTLLELERDTLLEIVQRDRERVRAELANYAAARELAAHKTLQNFAG